MRPSRGVQPVIAPPPFRLGGQPPGQGDPGPAVHAEEALFHGGDVEEVHREAGPAEEETLIRQQGGRLLLEGAPHRQAVQAGPVRQVVAHRPARQLGVDDLIQAHPLQPVLRADGDAGGPFLLQRRHGLVQHREELVRLRRLHEVVKGPGGVGVHGVLRGDGEIDDGPVGVQLPQADPQFDAAKARHHDVQHVEVEAAALLGGGQKVLAGGKD